MDDLHSRMRRPHLRAAAQEAEFEIVAGKGVHPDLRLRVENDHVTFLVRGRAVPLALRRKSSLTTNTGTRDSDSGFVESGTSYVSPALAAALRAKPEKIKIKLRKHPKGEEIEMKLNRSMYGSFQNTASLLKDDLLIVIETGVEDGAASGRITELSVADVST